MNPTTVSIVFEWQNILLAEASQAQRMLEVLPGLRGEDARPPDTARRRLSAASRCG
jgi:hypothetical protein